MSPGSDKRHGTCDSQVSKKGTSNRRQSPRHVHVLLSVKNGEEGRRKALESGSNRENAKSCRKYRRESPGEVSQSINHSVSLLDVIFYTAATHTSPRSLKGALREPCSRTSFACFYCAEGSSRKLFSPILNSEG